MTVEYRKAVRKLFLEHELKLVEPDEVLREVRDPEHPYYKLCRDSKDLWICNRGGWEHASAQFCQQAPSLRSQWIPKPNGDPDTLPQGHKKYSEIIRQVFSDLILDERARYVPQSTDPFSQSQLYEIFAAGNAQASDAESQELPLPLPLTSKSLALKEKDYSSSSDTFNPKSSWLEELVRENDTDGHPIVAARHNGNDYDNDDRMMVDEEDGFTTPHGTPLVLEQPNIALEPAHGTEVISLSNMKKRPSSSCNAETKTSKRLVADNTIFRVPSNESKPAFSFNNGTNSSISRSATRSLSRTTSAATSFRSASTYVNESFSTNGTSPSFHVENGTSLATILANIKQQAGLGLDVDKHAILRQYLDHRSPFTRKADVAPIDMSFRVAYEIIRVSLHNAYDPAELFHLVRQNARLPRHSGGTSDRAFDIGDSDALWSFLGRYMKQQGGLLPVKISEKAWKVLSLPRDHEKSSEITFMGVLSLSSTTSDISLDVKLQPISIETSNVLKRKYGCDRIFVLGVPSLSTMDLPPILKASSVEFRTAFIEWLATSTHHFIGQQWRAFYVKLRPHNKSKEPAPFEWKIYMFAVDGNGFKQYEDGDKTMPKRIPLEQMLEWFFWTRTNASQPALKLFSRLQLAVSDTIPTLTFEPSQIIQVPDLTIPSPDGLEDIIMTDGCGRISLKAAQIISRMLGISSPVPCAFQARIAGAKGMWITDSDSTPRNGSDIWIEITASQIKFESLIRDQVHPDQHRVTFGVHEFCKPLRPAAMNFQILPILINGGVNGQVFKDLLKADLDTKVADLEAGMSTAQGLRAWSQEQHAVAGPRLGYGGIMWDGGMPRSDEEEINALAEAGFTPESCPRLRDLCHDAVTQYCKRVQERMNIFPGQTTFAYMVPDFWGVLQENEIHVGFSSNFTDKRLNWSDTMLHDIDVLVARLPAVLPSDIHKVRAVFKTELAHLKDVVVFPTRGSYCLADKLSGGDYDGDRAWICWNETIVREFKNHDAPEKKDYKHYGIAKDSTRVEEILSRGDKASQMTELIKKGLEFNMRRSLLGKCTNAHEALCYKLVKEEDKKKRHKSAWYSPMSDPRAMDLGILLGYLVDTAKSGFTFSEEDCEAYLKSIGALALKPPAYKIQENPSNHIIDELVLKIAIKFRQQALIKLDQITKVKEQSHSDRKDKDLLRVLENEEEKAKQDPALAIVLKQLKSDAQDTYKTYILLVEEQKRSRRTWPEVAHLSRESFMKIMPASGQHENIDLDKHPLIQRWRESVSSDQSSFVSTVGSWSLLKASAIYKILPFGGFPWKVCGKELMAVKLLANQQGVSIHKDVHQYLKVDRKMWENAKLKASEKERYGLHDDIVLDLYEDLPDQDYETAYESQANAE